MRIWFDGSKGNPNTAVARWKIQQMKNGESSLLPIPVIIPLLFLGLGTQ